MASMKGQNNPAYQHGFAGSSEIGGNNPMRSLYIRWMNMKARCHQPSNKDYKRYGARGVTVCDRWRHGENGISGFILFVEDMGEPPFDGASLDRIDRTKGYSPDNVRWATLEEQTFNKEKITWLEVDGVRKPLTQWARELGIGPKTIHYRLRAGLTHKEALTIPVSKANTLRRTSNV